MTITVTDARVTFEWMIPGDDGKPIKPNGDGFTERTTACVFGNEPAENIRSMSRLYCSAKWEGDHLVTTTHEPTFPLVAKGTRSLGTGTYSVSGAELRVRSVVPRPTGGAPFVSEVSWDRLK